MDRICGVMVNVLASSAVDRGFIGSVMVSVLASSAVGHGFEPQSGQTKDYKLVFFGSPLNTQHSGWLGIKIMHLSGATCLPTDLFQWASTIKIQLSVLIYYKADIITIISLNITCSLHDLDEYGLFNNNHSLSLYITYYSDMVWFQF